MGQLLLIRGELDGFALGCLGELLKSIGTLLIRL
jgi:hypothetical protein